MVRYHYDNVLMKLPEFTTSKTQKVIKISKRPKCSVYKEFELYLNLSLINRTKNSSHCWKEKHSVYSIFQYLLLVSIVK